MGKFTKLTNLSEKNKKEIDKEKKKIPHIANLVIPFALLRNRNLSILEVIVVYLKEEKDLSYHEISILINRDERNIWTIYNRAKKKRELGEKKS